MDKKYEGLPEEVPHPIDPAHKLKLVQTTGAFVCAGCKEPGDGPRYTSGDDDCGSRSSIRLHTSCARAGAATPLQHPLFPGRTFVFLPNPTPAAVDEKTVCDACGEPARGFVYHCSEEGEGGLDVHPCCWSLQPTIILQGEPKPLELCNKASRHCAFCGKKGRRNRFWAYRWYNASDGRHVYLHVACVKKVASRTWDEDHHKRVGSGGGIVQASMPAIEAAVQQSLARNAPNSRSSGFDRVMKIVSTVAQIVIAAIFGNPFAMIDALVGPGGFLRG